jgi:hypothetical protein
MLRLRRCENAHGCYMQVYPTCGLCSMVQTHYICAVGLHKSQKSLASSLVAHA